jgi:hypothetical protein
VKRRRTLVALLGLLAAAGAGFVGTALVRRAADARRLAAVIAELDRTDPGWRLDDLDRARPEVPDAENFAVAFAAAYPKFTKYRPPALRPLWNQVIALKDELVPNVRLTAEQESKVRRHFAANAAAAPDFLALAGFARGRHVVVWNPDASSDLDHVNRMRPVATGVLLPLALLAPHDGDAATALTAFRANLAFGRSLRDEPITASQMVRTQFQRDALRGVERLLGHRELTADQLALVRRELTAELADDPWPLVTRDQRAFADAFLNALRGGAAKTSTSKPLLIPDYKPTPAGRAGDWLADHVAVDIDAAHAFVLELTTRLVATERLSWPERVAAAEALDAEWSAGPAPAAWLAQGRVARCACLLLAVRARVLAAVAAVAVEQHRAERGDWPASLPGGLPDDPYTGRPLLLRRLADGVVVYSVGPNGRDDGGTLMPETGEPNPKDGDIGFRLWDVVRRNRPAGDEP